MTEPQKRLRENWVRQGITLLLFGMAFAYIEAAVVVYLRAVFYPDGFTFPIADFSQMEGARSFFVMEVGREVATMVLLVTSSLLMARRLRRRVAFFLAIFAIWDIFYYVWLKVLIGWPASILDWDILFLIPMVWAGPVLAPVITSITMLGIAAVLLSGQPMHVSRDRLILLGLCALGIIAVFCVGGLKITQPDYKSVFYWPTFLVLHVAIVALILISLVRTQQKIMRGEGRRERYI